MKEGNYMGVMLKRSIAIIMVVLVSVGLAGGLVTAQSNTNVSGNGFRISPVRSDLTIEKGKASSITITVENPTDYQTVATPIINDFIASDKEDGAPRLILDSKSAPTPKNDFKSLVQPIDNISLGPKEKKDITVKLNVPSSASSGGYYGAIRFAPSVIGGGGNVSLTASVGTIVLVTVPGDLVQKLDLVQMSAEQKSGNRYNTKSFLTSGDVSVMTRLKNSGDIHVQPFGRVQIKNMFGHVVTSYELNNVEPKSNVLPGSIRRFDDKVNYNKWFGRYTIEANLGYSQGSGKLISSKATFWYIPALVIYATLAVVVIATAGGYLYFVKRNQKTRRNR